MCYGGLDPKYLMRDADERMKGVAFTRDTSEVAGKLPDGLWARLLSLIRHGKQKDVAHG